MEQVTTLPASAVSSGELRSSSQRISRSIEREYFDGSS